MDGVSFDKAIKELKSKFTKVKIRISFDIVNSYSE